jgi:hypothetical protein
MMSAPHTLGAPAEDGYLRSLSIFDRVGDPTLDTAPIQHSMPPRDRLLPGILTLTALGGIVTALIIWPELLPTPGFGLGRFHEGSRRVDFLLGAGAARDLAGRAPAPDSEGPLRPLDNGAPSRAVEPGSMANPMPTSSGAAGPGRAGGASGSGEGHSSAQGGVGDGLGTAQSGQYQAPGYDHRLVPIFKPVPAYTAGAGESLDFLAETVTVIASVAEDGTVTKAWATDGPPKLFQLAVQAAMRWRFEPLAAHGLKAPQEMKILFHCRLL